jgi:hypothetical protein
MRTTFVSIKGGDDRWFKDALDRGDLPLVKATAAQLPAVNLEDAPVYREAARDTSLS